MAKKTKATVQESPAEVPATGAPIDNGAAPAVLKTRCPVTREQFRDRAPRVLAVSVNGVPLAAPLKEFSTGSLGWFANQKIMVEVDGGFCSAQVGLNITLVGSKDLPGKE